MLRNYKISGVIIAITLLLTTSIACTAKHETTPTHIDDSFSMLTPYVNASDMASINEAFSSTSSAPWGFEHNGVDFFPAGNYKPFQAVVPGTVTDVLLNQNDKNSNWQVSVNIKVDQTYSVTYGFEPFSAIEADSETQLANIFVSKGQKVEPSDIIGNLFTVNPAAHVHFMLLKNGVSICPEPYFTESARDSILDLIHKDNPTWNMCYDEGTTAPVSTSTPVPQSTSSDSILFPGAFPVSVPPTFNSEWGIDSLQTSVYGTMAEANEILQWYRNNMTGWTLQQEGATFQKYSKNADGALIFVVPPPGNQGQGLLVMAFGSWELVQASASQICSSSTSTPTSNATSEPADTTTPTPTPTSADSISMLTPYVSGSDMNTIREAFSSSSSAPWNSQHNGIDFFPAGNYKPFQAVASGTVENVSLIQLSQTSNWQVNVRLRVNPTYCVNYAFEPMSASEADGNTQLANIFVSEGQSVAQGNVIGNLFVVDTGAAHVHFMLLQHWMGVCPEPYFTASARDSILELIHKDNPTWNMCY